MRHVEPIQFAFHTYSVDDFGLWNGDTTGASDVYRRLTACGSLGRGATTWEAQKKALPSYNFSELTWVAHLIEQLWPADGIVNENFSLSLDALKEAADKRSFGRQLARRTFRHEFFEEFDALIDRNPSLFDGRDSPKRDVVDLFAVDDVHHRFGLWEVKRVQKGGRNTEPIKHNQLAVLAFASYLVRRAPERMLVNPDMAAHISLIVLVPPEFPVASRGRLIEECNSEFDVA